MKKNKYVLVAWLAALTFTVSSCYYDTVLDIEPPAEDIGTVLFSTDIIPLFNKDCNSSGCHNGTVAPNLSPAVAYNSLINGGYISTASPENSELYQWMRGKRSQPMPLSGPNATYNAKVLAWIKQGAQNN